MADRQEGQTQISMIALAYSDQNAAQQASVELQSRITSFDTEKIDKLTSAKVDPGYVYQDANGQYVAVVVVRYPLPSTQRDPSTSGRIPPGMVFYLWNSTLMQAKFYLLTSGMPSQ